MISEDCVDLLSGLAAIVTIITGINGFLGNKYNRISKILFIIFTAFMASIFIKEIICLLDYFLVPVSVLIFFFVCLHIKSHNEYSDIKTKTIICVAIICLTILMTYFQKYIVNLFIPEFASSISDFLNQLNNKNKIFEIYRFLTNSSNIIFTLSYVLNIIIVWLSISSIRTITDYLDCTEFKIDKLIFYSIALLILSLGTGVKVIQIIIEKF